MTHSVEGRYDSQRMGCIEGRCDSHRTGCVEGRYDSQHMSFVEGRYDSQHMGCIEGRYDSQRMGCVEGRYDSQHMGCIAGVDLGGIPLSRTPQILRRNTRFAGTVIRPDYQLLPRFGDPILGLASLD